MTKRIRRPLAVLLAGAMALTASGCAGAPTQAAQTTIFAMDTVMNLTLYGRDEQADREALGQMVEQIYDLEGVLSATDGESELSALNQAGGEPVQLSPELAHLLEQALELCEVTGGALDITAAPAVRAWGFLSGDYRIPEQEELEELQGRIDYTRVELKDGGWATCPAGMELDLGAVAKGYLGDVLSEWLREAGYSSALLDLGQSSIQAVGSKPDGTAWRIGIQDPEGEGYLGVLELQEGAVGTSGGYQRYFEEDGVRYWHIMDPDTAAPARSGLTSVTVVGTSGLVCDGLSTALFVMGLEEGTRFWRDHPDLSFDVIFVAEDGGIYVTAGLEDDFALADGYKDREVTVLE